MNDIVTRARRSPSPSTTPGPERRASSPRAAAQLAERIIETAREHNVPLQEDAALVAALSRLDLGREIPRELYVAVAHVLAFAWGVSGKTR